MKGRKGKGKGGKKGGQKGKGKPGSDNKTHDPNELCRKWAEGRCTHYPCKFKHVGKGGYAPEAQKGKGVAAQQSPGAWVPSDGQPQQWDNQPGVWVPSGGQPQQWQQQGQVTGMPSSGQPQQWPAQSTAIVPYQSGASVQRSNLLQNVAPQHRAIVEQYLRNAPLPAAAGTSNFGPSGSPPTFGNSGFQM
jgi:hypothetical protein